MPITHKEGMNGMITKSLIDKMLEMPDDKLLVMLKIVLANSGLGGEQRGKNAGKIDEKTLRRLRRVLAEITDDDIDRITYLTDVYKNGD